MQISDLNIQIKELKAPKVDETNLEIHTQQYEILIQQISRINKEYLMKQSEIQQSHKQLYSIESNQIEINRELDQTQKKYYR